MAYCLVYDIIMNLNIIKKGIYIHSSVVSTNLVKRLYGIKKYMDLDQPNPASLSGKLQIK